MKGSDKKFSYNCYTFTLTYGLKFRLQLTLTLVITYCIHGIGYVMWTITMAYAIA